MNGQTKLSSPWRIAIVGGGPSGLTTARILAVNGISSTVYEAEEGEGARWSGGTLDLRPSTGRRAIAEAHLDEEFERLCRYEGQESYILDHKANVLLSHSVPKNQPHEEAAPEINRGDLRTILLEGLNDDTVKWGHKLAGATEKKTADGQIEYELEFANGKKATADFVIGADGTFSKTRTFLVDPNSPVYTGITLVQLLISPNPNVRETDRFPGIENIFGQGLGLASDFGKNLLFQREKDGMIRFYASQFMPQEAKLPEDIDEVKRKLLSDFEGWDQKLLNFITEADDTPAKPWKIYASDPEEKRPVKLGVQLIGDANKHMSPYAGQGANTALADATDLALLLTKAVSKLDSNSSTMMTKATPSEKANALLDVQKEFSEIQYPRARDAARKSAAGFDMTFNHSAKERAEQLRPVFGKK